MAKLNFPLALGAILLSITAAAAQESADLISLSASVAQGTSNPGTTNEAACHVANQTTWTVRASLDAQVTYPDGSVARLSRAQPIELDPGQGSGMIILFVVPEGTPPGTATLQCEARATGGGVEHEVGTATFQVVAP